MKLDETEFLRLQVLNLRQAALTSERNAFVAGLIAKYAPGASGINVLSDGTVVPPTKKSKK